MQKINLYNQRQYLKMLNLVEAFRKNSIALSKFLADINALLYALEGSEKKWFNEFESHCATLDAIYAIALHRQQNKFYAHDMESIKDILDKLENMINKLVIKNIAL